MDELKTIYHPTQWFSSLRPGDVKVGRLITDYADQSFSVMLSRYNSRYGRERNLFVHYHFCRSKSVMVLVCVTLEEHQQESKQKKHEEVWRDKIPSPYRDR